MKEQLVSYDVAVMAKEKGFNEVCRHAYRHVENEPHCFDNGCSLETIAYFYTLCPTQSLLQKWLLEKHNTLVYVTTDWVSFQCWISTPDTGICEVINTKRNFEYFGWYGDAFEAGLKEALKLIK